ADVARAYSITREILDMREIWGRLEALDNSVSSRSQYIAYADTARLLRHVTMWLLRQRQQTLDVAATVKIFSAPMQQLRDSFPGVLAGSPAERHRKALAEYTAASLPPVLAAALADLRVLDNALDILDCAAQAKRQVRETAADWFRTLATLRLDWLEDRITGLAVDSSLQATARIGLRETGRGFERRIVDRVIAEGGIERWRAARAKALAHWERTVAEIAAQESADFASLWVCLDALRPLAD
ncbi:MAG: NAD-glutamate dehydrogenase, partial [Gammaproteobacteria bacterium]|nr:NAD-glutamate dehydrogenase [Gammaproteobacteria bacterium]